MRLDRIATQAKDPGLFPEYGAALQAGMARDMRGTWEALAFDDKASLFDLFTTTKVVVNAELARLYGLDATGLTSTTFQVRSLPADGPRAGILSKAGFLSQFANQKEGSPTLRGKFIREALTCRTVPPPPPDVNTSLPDPPADMPMTKRQRLERHRTEEALRSLSREHGSARAAARDLRRDRKIPHDGPRAADRSERRVRRARPSPMRAGSAPPPAPARPSPTASSASSTRTPSVTRSGAWTGACSTLFSTRSRRPATSCAT